jgi:hypothetical protein
MTLTGRKKNKHKTIPEAPVGAAINFPWALAAIAAWDDHLAPVAKMFSRAPWLDRVRSEVVDTIVPLPGSDLPTIKNPAWYVWVSSEETLRKPTMQIAASQNKNPETLTHELMHYYTITYIDAREKQEDGIIRITNARQASAARYLYEKLSDLYGRAVKKWYSAYNWSSMQNNLIEFAVNITHQNSSEELQRLWLYDEFMNIIQTHLRSIKSVDIEYEYRRKAA